jgi:hypothetical protein
LVYQIKEACWWLKNNEYEIHMMRIPSFVGVRGNERADQLASGAAENGIEWHAPVRPPDFLPLSGARLFEGWQSGWDGSDMSIDMFTLFGLYFHLCHGLGALTSTESSSP